MGFIVHLCRPAPVPLGAAPALIYLATSARPLKLRPLSQHEVTCSERDGAGQLNFKVGRAIAVNVALNQGEAASCLVTQLARRARESLRVDEREGLVRAP